VNDLNSAGTPPIPSSFRSVTAGAIEADADPDLKRKAVADEEHARYRGASRSERHNQAGAACRNDRTSTSPPRM
jgi:hypothetical protein